jgi:D-glycero-D-manno-heptose 1,7-bisphosphate phosphatase
MNRAVFIDRDGTITKDKGYIKDVSLLELIAGAAQAINGFHSLGFLVILVTNQSVVGRGYITGDKLAEIHGRLRELLSQEDSFLDAIYVCPHHPDDGCNCRKPRPGLVRRACKDFDIEMKKSYIIGDQKADIELGRREGIRSILVLTGHGKKTVEETSPDYVVDNILEAKRLIEKIEDGQTLEGE